MAERLNERVLVALSRGNIRLPWTSRTALLEQIRHLESAQPIVTAFQAVGTSRPVTLSQEQKALLIELIEFWGSQTAGGLKALPEGVFKLRNALHDDLHHSHDSQ